MLEFRYYSHSDKVTEKTVFLFKKYYNVDLYKYSTKGHSGCTVSSPSIGEDILIQIYNDFPSIAIPRKRNIIKGLVDDIVHRYEMINRNNW